MKKLVIAAALLAAVIGGCTYTPPAVGTSTTAPVPASTVATPPATTAATTSPEPADPVQILLESMTTEEKVGQLFLARCPDTGALEDITKYHVGGYILFGRDFEYEIPGSIRARIADFQSASRIPLLIAVDEEGGDVTRVSCFPTFRQSRFPSPRKLFDQGGMELVLRTEQEKCELLRSLGINVNMAPVCDITTERGAFMYTRSLGQDPQTTAQFVFETVTLMTNNSIGSVLKHFPGYGNNKDTHTGIAVDDRTLETLATADMIPFSAGIDAQCGAILVSHTIVSCLDSDHPASLSSAVHDYLRYEMGYDGVIVTDDLVMKAITDRYGDGEAAVLAVLAGNDLLCSSNYPVQYAAVLEAVTTGRIDRELLDTAVARILNWKLTLGLFTP